MRVLCDAIHADLWESLRLLFEVRFGWELYRPIGMDWYETGIWNFERARLGDVVARQFLDAYGSDVTVDWGPGNVRPLGTHLERPDTTHPGQRYKLVTMEQAADLKPDLVLATLAENEQGLWQWAKDHGAHYGIQVGNQGAPNLWPLAEFGMLSVTTPGFTPWKPFVTYHQEFDLSYFHADGGEIGIEASDPPEVMTRVQCFQTTDLYPRFREVAAAVPEAIFRWYGHCDPRDDLYGGDAPTTQAVAEEMHRAYIAYHDKRWSDGYGHVIHNWAAIGRPMFVPRGYYSDKLAGPLFTDDTSFDLERMGTGDVAATIRRLIHDKGEYRRMCVAAAQRFRDVVSFDEEAAQIKSMLEGVLSDRLVTA